MNLRDLIGKKCLVQFNNMFFPPVVAKNDEIGVAQVQEGQGVRLLSLPFVIGELKHSGESDQYYVQYHDQSSDKLIDVFFNEKNVIAISVKSEDQLMRPSRPRLVIPAS